MENVIMVFLLFFAVLAFGWFYLQRAKARDAAKASTAPQSTAHEPTTEPTSTTRTEEPPA